MCAPISGRRDHASESGRIRSRPTVENARDFLHLEPMNPEMDVGTNKKAFQINLDVKRYGTFAEIGAGQEVARRFFQVGGASGTVAKTMSAYDMQFSDAIYGVTDRYVSRARLQTMLDHEYSTLNRTARQEDRRRAHLLCFRGHGGGAEFQATQRIARLAGDAFPIRAAR